MQRQTADFDGGVEVEQGGLGKEDAAGAEAQLADLGLGELDLLGPPAALEEPPENVVDDATGIRRCLHILLLYQFNRRSNILP